MRLFSQRVALAVLLACTSTHAKLSELLDLSHSRELISSFVSDVRHHQTLKRSTQPSNHSASPYCNLVGRNITVEKQSSCTDLAAMYSVADHQVIDGNPWLGQNGTVTRSSPECVVPAGSIICLGQACNTYVIQPNDTCESIAANAPGYCALIPWQLSAYNNELGNECVNNSSNVGDRICIGFLDGLQPDPCPTKSASIATSTSRSTFSTASSASIGTLNSSAVSQSSSPSPATNSGYNSLVRSPSSKERLAWIYLTWGIVSYYLIMLR